VEHRYNPRLPTNIKLLIFRRGIPIATGFVRNISRGGMLIETDLRNVSVHERLEVELLSRLMPHGQRLRFSTRVAHKAAGGYGLELDELSVATETLSSLLASATASAPADAGAYCFYSR
jgi:hypothetical protein